jgi:hypothetical protein
MTISIVVLGALDRFKDGLDTVARLYDKFQCVASQAQPLDVPSGASRTDEK